MHPASPRPTTSDAAAASLGIDDLPAALATLSAGQLYAFEVETQSLRVPLIAQALQALVDDGDSCGVVVPGDPAAFSAKLATCGLDVASARARGRLHLVRQRPDPLLPLFRAGPPAVLELIDRSVPVDARLLVLELAEPFLFLADAAQAALMAEQLRAWAQQRGLAVLLTLSPAGRPQREFLTLRTILEDVAGFVIVRDRDGELHYEVRHWFGPAGLGHRTRLTLERDANGRLRACPPVAPLVPPAPAVPVGRVVALAAAVDDATALRRDAQWTIVDTPAALGSALRELQAGAVVLPFDRHVTLRALCETVAQVRHSLPAWVSVVVRERGYRLRLVQQVALTRAGASCVVALAADDADLQQAVRALAGTAFAREVPRDVDETIAAVGGLVAAQLMVGRQFRDLVVEVLAASDGGDLPHALMHVRCDPAKAQQIGTQALQRKLRDAALTVDASGLWVFLFGCPPARALRVAERAFGRQYRDVAEGIEVLGNLPAIARRLETLAAPVGASPLPQAHGGVPAGQPVGQAAGHPVATAAHGARDAHGQPVEIGMGTVLGR